MIELDGREVRVGPAGWSYDDWRGIVYPREPGSRFDRLAYIARYFDLIEVNSSYYAVPSERRGASWVSRVSFNESFELSVKLNRAFTHDPVYAPGPVTESFRDFLRPIREDDRLAAVLAQFPFSFRDGKDSRDRIERIREDFHDVPLAVEVRNTSFGADFGDFLAAREIATVSIDQPSLEGFAPPAEMVTSGLAYVRLHGRNAEGWFDHEESWQRYDYLYGGEEISEWASRIKRFDASRILVIMNNHFRGQGVLNGLQLRAELGERVKAPESVSEYYGTERCRGIEIDSTPQLGLPFGDD